jgi:hypothetical protein
MRYKEQTITKLDALDNHLYSIIKGLDMHTLTAVQVVQLLEDSRKKVAIIISAIELE